MEEKEIDNKHKNIKKVRAHLLISGRVQGLYPGYCPKLGSKGMD